MKIDSFLSESEILVNELSKINIERLLNEELTKENLAIIFDPNVTEDEKKPVLKNLVEFIEGVKQLSSDVSHNQVNPVHNKINSVKKNIEDSLAGFEKNLAPDKIDQLSNALERTIFKIDPNTITVFRRVEDDFRITMDLEIDEIKKRLASRFYNKISTFIKKPDNTGDQPVADDETLVSPQASSTGSVDSQDDLIKQFLTISKLVSDIKREKLQEKESDEEIDDLDKKLTVDGMGESDDEEEIENLLRDDFDVEDDDFDVEDDDSNDKEIAELIADDEVIYIDELMAFTNSSHLGQESEGISRHFARRDYHSPDPTISTKAETKKLEPQTKLEQIQIFNGNKFKTDEEFLKLFLKLLSSKNLELKDREFNIPDQLLQSILNGAKKDPGQYFDQMLGGTIFAPSKTKSQEESESAYDKSKKLFSSLIGNNDKEKLKKLLNSLLRNGFKKINYDLNNLSGTRCSKSEISEDQLKTDHLGFKLFQNNLRSLILEIRNEITDITLNKIQNKVSGVSAKSHQHSKKIESTSSNNPAVVDENSSSCSPFFNFLKIKFFNRTSSTYQVKEGSPSSSPTKPQATSLLSRFLNCFTRSSE